MDTATLHQATDLDALIPAPSVAAGYINRTWGGYPEFDTFEAALVSGHNVLIEGPTGCGKTHSVRAFAASKGLPFYTVAVNGELSMSTIIAAWVPDSTGSLVRQDGVLTSMIRERRGVVLFDEINMGPERNLARFYDLWDSRREIVLYEFGGEVVKVQPGSDILFCAAYNRGYRGTRELSQALPNRFAFKMGYSYDPDIEARLAPSSSLREAAAKLRAMHREVKTPVSTNMLQEFCEIAEAFNPSYAIANFCQAFPEGEAESVAQVMSLYEDRIESEIAELSSLLDEA